MAGSSFRVHRNQASHFDWRNGRLASPTGLQGSTSSRRTPPYPLTSSPPSMSRLYRSSGGALSPSPSPSATPTPLQTAAAASAGASVRANRSATPGSLFGGGEGVDDEAEWGGVRSVYGSSGSGRNSAASAQQRRGHTHAAAAGASSTAAAAAAASAASAPSPAAVAAAASASLAALAAPSPLLLRNTTAADRRLMVHRARVTLARLQAQADGTAPRPGEPFRWNSPFVKKEKRLKMVMAIGAQKGNCESNWQLD